MARGDKGKKKQQQPSFWKQHKHLFQKNNRNFTVGGDVRKVKDLGRYVRWPKYIRIQRQRAILKKRIKTPPAINHFQTKALNVHQASVLFQTLRKYKPETRQEKKERLRLRAEALDAGKETNEGKPKVLKFGMNDVTALIESKRAKLVVIAHDVDPIELIVWMPALCRAMDVPYVIVKGKAALGRLVHMKITTCVALTEIRKEDLNTVEQLLANFRPQFNDLPVEELRKWGAHQLGTKANARNAKLRRKKLHENQGFQ